ncbi:unnamed protein product [Sympodiomycopsis kandeliae]
MAPILVRRSTPLTGEKGSEEDSVYLLPCPSLAQNPPTSPPCHSRTRFRALLFSLLAALAIFSFISTDTSLTAQFPSWSSISKHHKDDGGPINVILMISDGYGPASHTLARYFHQAASNSSHPPRDVNFASDQYLVGSHRSRSSSSLITDSAAGATAFSCGVKSYNGAIGVDSNGRSCGTIFEAAKEKDYLTGVVVTSRLTDATPACFFAHASSRALETTIASQMLEKPFKGGKRTIDLAIGGGGCYFLPKGDPSSCRTDERDLVTEATEDGWDVRIGETFSTSRRAFAQKGPHGEDITTFDESPYSNVTTPASYREPRLPYLSLLTGFNTPYVVDLPSDQEGKDSFPTLAELSEQALSILASGENDKSTGRHSSKRRGFMLMIEGSQIDLCQHHNDPGCMVREAVAFQDALASVIHQVDELNKRGQRTIVIATSDHETGGLDLGRQIGTDYPEYVYYPERLLPVQASAQTLSTKLLNFAKEDQSKDTNSLREFITSHILGPIGGLGFGSKSSGGQVSEEEIAQVLSCLPSPQTFGEAPPIDNSDSCRQVIADLSSRRSRIGWSTPGHTGVDIPVYAHGFGSEGLHGNIENTDIARFVQELLRLDLEGVTKRLRK